MNGNTNSETPKLKIRYFCDPFYKECLLCEVLAAEEGAEDYDPEFK